ncbi:MAG TPA: dipeptidase [Terriglobia bacterium]|nr:dipeptidase [Terriglobia bacterium]
MKRWLTLALLCASSVALGDDLERARQIHKEAIGIDSHIDTLQWVMYQNADLSKRHLVYHVDFPRLHEGGMLAPYFALYVPTYYQGSEAVRRILQLRDAMQRVLDANPGKIELAYNASDILRIVKAGRVAAVLTIESGHAIADDLGVLRMFYQLGVRSMTLVHFRNNNWADSSTDEPRHNGLTELGKNVVQEMNRLGMVVDISHVSDKTFYDTLAVTTKPVIASHSSCRALSDFPRNMTDDMLRALARNGGVIGINFGGGFLSQKDADGYKKRITDRGGLQPPGTGSQLDDFAKQEFISGYLKMSPSAATLEDTVAHIDHVVKVAGVDHVGIGSDFDGISSVPAGLEDVSKMPHLTAALLKRGYSEADLKKILGGNHLRVLRAVTGK